MKQCTNCLRVLPITEFYRNRATKDGLQCICKDCSMTKAYSYLAINREKINATRRERQNKRYRDDEQFRELRKMYANDRYNRLKEQMNQQK